MRLASGHHGGEEERAAQATVAAAVGAGITVFDTARAYDGPHLHPTAVGRPSGPGGNEGLLARALRACGGADRARIVTKGGMDRPGGAWLPDGRARTIRADAEASLAALDGIPVDLHLLHAPDHRTPWPTSVRALARLVEDGLVARVGVANVTLGQLEQALDLAPVSAVQVALSVLDDTALRSGVVERCTQLGLTVIAHSPLGGPRRAAAIGRDPTLAQAAQRHRATPAEVALAWLLDLGPHIVAIPGATRPGTARSAARAAALRLDDDDRQHLAGRFGWPRPAPPGPPPAPVGRARPGPELTGAGAVIPGEVVVIMGIPGAGKSRAASELVARGYVRLNRDDRGGTLRDLAAALDHALPTGVPGVVLDNTYLTRAARSHVIDAARRHGAAVRCLWLDTPLAQAQVNLVQRLIGQVGRLPDPDELRTLARRLPGVLSPTAQMRARRQLEPPAAAEGFASVDQVPFQRSTPAGAGQGAVFVAAAALREPGWRELVAATDPSAPHLVFDWRPKPPTAPANQPEPTARGHQAAPTGGDGLGELVALLATAVAGPVEAALCPHPGGPPICWCRPPLPGLPLAFAYAHGIDPSCSVVVGTTASHRALANALDAAYRSP